MTELLKVIGIGCALWCLLSAAATVVYILVKRWPLNSLGAATPTPAAAEGTGARPASESGGIAPCAAPPQDASRPTRGHNWRSWTTCDCGQRGCLSYHRDRLTPAQMADLRRMAEQVEATTYDDEVQP